MNSSDPTTFWFENLGQFLSDNSPETTTACIIPHRTLKGIKSIRIGALDAFYIVTPAESILIGRVEQPDSSRVRCIGTENISARKYLAEWLLNSAEGPYMIGVLGKASAQSSLRLSHHITQSQFGEAGGGFSFDLQVVRNAQKKIALLPWKTIVAPAIHQYDRLCHATPQMIDREREKLQKLLLKTPELRSILPSLKVLPKSGEYTILSWLNIEKSGPKLEAEIDQ